MAHIKPYSHLTTNGRVLEILTREDIGRQRILDFGAGEGYFSAMLGEHLKNRCSTRPSDVLRACDLDPKLFKYSEVPCDGVGMELNLPYEDNSFDAVCSIEVIEHVENQFHLIQEFFRIVKPGGKAIVSTPNILNINSRIRFMHSGFGLLFNPLPFRQTDRAHLSGHIHPVSFYYLAYIFYQAGFRQVRLHFDRRKKSAAFWTVLLYSFIMVGHFGFRLHVSRKGRNVYEENKPLLDQVNSFGMLTSRSLIIEGIK